ncbi:MAG: radical SAM protein [Anaerolineae bacterium]|nr:radical SAM protein [Anaerolineae bacterium]MCX8067554.1 radical SAM protein [Anaerolineae bacterium]
MSQAEFLFHLPWEDLQAAAWAVRRQYHPPEIFFAVPSLKRYETEDYRNTSHRFASISLTGERCALECEHCRGQLLKGMIPATTPQALLALGRWLVEQGCAGVLISGGSDRNGAVPLKPYLEAIARLKALGLRVVVHTGLPDRETAEGLKAAGVDQVLFDFIGDAATLREVLHLNRSPEEYAEALALLRELGIPVAPHIVIGLYFGQLRGELAALEVVSRIGADVLVLVVLRPLPGTPMADLLGVDPETVGRLTAVARLLNPRTPLALGCARPAGPAAAEMEERALLAGVNRIAYPHPRTVRRARELGLEYRFVENCCTL